MKPPVISVVGVGGCGKTTFLEKVIGAMTRRGWKVGVIKNDVHGFDIDVPGKTTWKFRQAGSPAVMIVGPEKMAFIKMHPAKEKLDRYLDYFKDMDLVLTEGFRMEDQPKIELVRNGQGGRMLCSEEELLAVVTEVPLLHFRRIPIFGFEEEEKILLFLERYIRSDWPSLQGSEFLETVSGRDR